MSLLVAWRFQNVTGHYVTPDCPPSSGELLETSGVVLFIWKAISRENTAVIKMIMIQSERADDVLISHSTPSICRTHTAIWRAGLCVCFLCVLSIIQGSLPLDIRIQGSLKHSKHSQFVLLSDQIAHTETVSKPSVSADSTKTLVMFSGLMVAFIYHGNVHEAVTGALQTWEVTLTCLLHAVHHWTGTCVLA